MKPLDQIHRDVQGRALEIATAQGDWPCRKGCDDCCRRLAAPPRVTAQEWRLIASAIHALPADAAEHVRQRIRDAAHLSRPVVCPLLDLDSGTCLVYEARPVACRAYGFYAERGDVLGCSRIEAVSRQSPDIIWGNHAALEERVSRLGPSSELSAWLGPKQNDNSSCIRPASET